MSDNGLPAAIVILREWGPDLIVGPYPSEVDADHAMENALLIDGFCEEDCLDCYTTVPYPQPWGPWDGPAEWVIIDLDDPHHTGRV